MMNNWLIRPRRIGIWCVGEESFLGGRGKKHASHLSRTWNVARVRHYHRCDINNLKSENLPLVFDQSFSSLVQFYDERDDDEGTRKEIKRNSQLSFHSFSRLIGSWKDVNLSNVECVERGSEEKYFNQQWNSLKKWIFISGIIIPSFECKAERNRLKQKIRLASRSSWCE